MLKKTPLIDGHNDLLMMIRYAYKNRIYDDGEGGFKKGFEEDGLRMQTDSMRLEEGKVGGVFWSLFMPCPRNGSDWREQNYYDSEFLDFSLFDGNGVSAIFLVCWVGGLMSCEEDDCGSNEGLTWMMVIQCILSLWKGDYCSHHQHSNLKKKRKYTSC